MKRDRQAAILQLIQKSNIQTQEELADRLNEAGFGVTQATVSRDIRDLRLVKVVGATGHAHYAVKPFVQEEENPEISRFTAVLQEGFVSAACAGNILVIKTVIGMAMAVAASIDSMEMPEIIGSIAGDDTIFLAVGSSEECRELKAQIDRMVRRDLAER